MGRELEGLVDMFYVQCINHNVETVLDLSEDMPKVVRGDFGRVVQVFANLINNSIKFTTSGHVILRGWCEYTNSCGSPNFHLDKKKSRHGGTSLGLCIVRNLIGWKVNKMGGEIKVTKKEGQGTLMRLCLLLSAPMDVTEQHCSLNLTDSGLVVLLALQGNMSRLVTSKWLTKKGVCTMEASEWNKLTQVLRELFNARSSIHNNNLDAHYSINLEGFKSKLLTIKDMRNPIFVIVVNISLLNLSTNIWKEQLNFLHKYFGRAKFVWMLNHDTSNTIKMELRRKGHLLIP